MGTLLTNGLAKVGTGNINQSMNRCLPRQLTLLTDQGGLGYHINHGAGQNPLQWELRPKPMALKAMPHVYNGKETL